MSYKYIIIIFDVVVGIKTSVIPTQAGELIFKKFQNVNEHILTGWLLDCFD